MLNWFADDGIYLPMINDHSRNFFYESILSQVVKNRNCVEIGFGTGILSMIALKHGARHIFAYEKDSQRYDLGRRLIKELGFEHQITLVNEQYHSELFDPECITFSEILDQNIWGEGLWQCLPRVSTDNFLPTSYFLEIVDIPLPKEFFFNQGQWFSPGIDLPNSYCETLNKIISQDVTQNQYQEYIKSLKGSFSKAIHYLLVKDSIKKNILDGYVVNTKDCSITSNGFKNLINFDATNIQFDINLDPAVPHLLLPRVGIESNKHKLYLDVSTNWGPASGSKIIEIGITRAKVKHQLDDGLISIDEDR